MKKLIRIAWTGRSLDENKLTQALLQYRNTPSRKDRLSPTQKLFNQRIQDTLPAHRRAFSPEWQRRAAETERQALHTVEESSNRHGNPLPEIVMIQSHSSKPRHKTMGHLWHSNRHKETPTRLHKNTEWACLSLQQTVHKTPYSSFNSAYVPYQPDTNTIVMSPTDDPTPNRGNEHLQLPR